MKSKKVKVNLQNPSVLRTFFSKGDGFLCNCATLLPQRIPCHTFIAPYLWWIGGNDVVFFFFGYGVEVNCGVCGIESMERTCGG